MWTLLKQSPFPNRHSIDKAIVVCPSSLVRNWANELGALLLSFLFLTTYLYPLFSIVKWLGEGAVSPLAIDGKQSNAEITGAIRQWCSSKGKQVVTPVVIVSYERLRMLSDELGNSEVGLLLADEGHRLKNSGELERARCGRGKADSDCDDRQPHLHRSQRHQLQAPRHPHRHAHPSSSLLVSRPRLSLTSFSLFSTERPRRVLLSPLLLQPGLPRHQARLPQEVRAAHPSRPRRRCDRLAEDQGRRGAQGAEYQGQQVHHSSYQRLALQVPSVVLSSLLDRAPS